MEIYVAYHKFHDQTTLVYVGTDLEKAKSVLAESKWAYERGIEVWVDGQYDGDIIL